MLERAASDQLKVIMNSAEIGTAPGLQNRLMQDAMAAMNDEEVSAL
eukprot:SAG31_NODE_13788_length_847_cov_0.890374_1_plen_45_part_10